MSDIPTLRTPRLLLRPPEMRDFEAYFGLMRSERSRFMGGPFDETRAWGLFCHDIACWDLFGHGALMVDIEEASICVGQVGINHGPLFPEKELGWLIYDGFEGQGYATEAAAALLNWAFKQAEIGTLVSYFDPLNHRSIAVARRLGGRLDPEAPRHDPEDIVYRYDR